MRHLIVEVLRECGYTVLEAGNSSEALPLGEHYEGKIDLLITNGRLLDGLGNKAVFADLVIVDDEIKTCALDTIDSAKNVSEKINGMLELIQRVDAKKKYK